MSQSFSTCDSVMETTPSRRSTSTEEEEELMEKDPKLPQELVEDILTRLPYKNLARFKSVCKNWYEILNDPLFLSRHTSIFIKHHSGGDYVLLRLSFPTIFGNGLESYKLFSLSAMDADPSAVQILRPKFNMLSNKFHLAGHCNGILCLSTDYWPRSKEVLLYNPATREFRCLPDSELRMMTQTLALAVGMGYDPLTDDYKVMRIWRVEGYANNGMPVITYWVEEYALSTDSWERLHDTNAGSFHFGKDCFAMCFNRIFFWWAFTRGHGSSVILAFNMETKVFQMVPVPEYINISNPNGRSLAVWNNSISLISCTYYGLTTSIDIWILNASGAEVSWTQLRSIRHLREDPAPLVFWKGNELLMEMSSGKIKSYDVDTQEIRDVVIKGHPIRHSSQAVNYRATTVSLRGGGGNYLV